MRTSIKTVHALTMILGGFSSGAIFAQSDADSGSTLEEHNVMMVLDASGSMWGRIDSTPKIVVARDVIRDVLDDWNQAINIGLMAYGHRREGDCSDIEVLSPVGTLDRKSFISKMDGINPRGKTPITSALREAAAHLDHTNSQSSVILVSDGLETCGSDPCQIASELNQSGINFTIHVVGFGVTTEESAQLQCIAENTGGKYLDADSASEFTLALSETVATVSSEQPPTSQKAPDVIQDLDLSKLAFDVQTFERDADSGKVVATGTSNGVGWTVVATNIYKPLTNMNGGARFNDLPGDYDDLHVGSNFTITFDRPVTSLLVTLANDNDTGDGPNFLELAPVDFIDASNPGGGTQVRIEDRGGALFYYYDLTSLTLTHVNDNGINDGFDLAFFAFPKAN